MYGCIINNNSVLHYNAVWHSPFIPFWLFLLESSQSYSQFWHGIILKCFYPHFLGRDTASGDLIQAGSACQQKPILPTDFQQSQSNQRKGLSWARSSLHPLQLVSAGNRKRMAVYLRVCLCHLWPVSVRKILKQATLAHLKCFLFLVTTLAFLAQQKSRGGLFFLVCSERCHSLCQF